jgi:hypothetical protein
MFEGNCIAETLRGGSMDLSKMGDISVRRSSEILFDENQQKYYVSLMEPKLLYMNKDLREKFFDTYELAIDHEVKILNRARKNGEV